MGKIELSLPNLKVARNRIKTDIPVIRYKLNNEYQDLGKGKTYHVFTYGCQGNLADSEVISGILEQIGYIKAEDPYKADLVILNTCAIRENAENRIWGVLGRLKGVKRTNG